MSSLTKPAFERLRSYEHMQSLVSVDMATQLQNLSMKRFQTEAANDIKLRRMIGHLSVNRRSTEIIKTATFMEDVFDELEEETMCDEDAVTCDISFDQTKPNNSSHIAEAQKVELETNQRRLQYLEMEAITTPAAAIIAESATRYQPVFSDIVAICAENEFLTQIDEDWMYNVLDLHIDLGNIAEPVPASHLPPSVVIQFWRHILASLSEFARSRKQHRSTYDVGQLEAYGLPDEKQLVGLGLQCHTGQNESFQRCPQLAT